MPHRLLTITALCLAACGVAHPVGPPAAPSPAARSAPATASTAAAAKATPAAASTAAAEPCLVSLRARAHGRFMQCGTCSATLLVEDGGQKRQLFASSVMNVGESDVALAAFLHGEERPSKDARVYWATGFSDRPESSWMPVDSWSIAEIGCRQP